MAHQLPGSTSAPSQFDHTFVIFRSNRTTLPHSPTILVEGAFRSPSLSRYCRTPFVLAAFWLCRAAVGQVFIVLVVVVVVLFTALQVGVINLPLIFCMFCAGQFWTPSFPLGLRDFFFCAAAFRLVADLHWPMKIKT